MKSFNEIIEDQTKTATKIPQSDYLENGKYRIFDQGKDYSVGFSNDENGVVTDFPYIIFGDHTRVVKFVNEPCFIGADGVKLLKVVNKDFDSKYIYYNILAKPIESHGYARHFKFVKEILFTEKSLPEQQKIANHLDTIQSAIDNKKKQLSELDELVKSKFVEMFGETPVESGKWKVEKLGSKSELITKGASPRWQGVEYQSEGTLFVTSENVREGYVDLTKSKYLPDEINEILPRSILKKNDVLINIVGASIGRAAIYEFEQKANINQAVALVRLNSTDLDKTFLLIYLNSELAMKLYQSMIKGGARDNLSLRNISDLEIPVPPIELQNTFAEYVQKIDTAKVIVKKQLVDLQELLDSKMDEYFG